MLPFAEGSATGAPLTRKMSKRPSLSKSNNATPDPIVSIRYFLEVCDAMCWKRTPSSAVASENLPGTGFPNAADDCCGLVDCIQAKTSSRPSTERISASMAGVCSDIVKFHILGCNVNPAGGTYHSMTPREQRL